MSKKGEFDQDDLVRCVKKLSDEWGKKFESRSSEKVAENYDCGFVRKAVDGGVNVNSRMFGFNLLDCAIMGNAIDAARLLVRRGADVDGDVIREDHGYSPLHRAVLLKRLEMVEFLIKEGANVNITMRNPDEDVSYDEDEDEDEDEAGFYIAPVEMCDIEAKDVIKLLIENGANVSEFLYNKIQNDEELLQYYNIAKLCEFKISQKQGQPASNLAMPFDKKLYGKILYGQLVQNGSLETLNNFYNKLPQTDTLLNVIKKIKGGIIEKHAVRLYNSILSGKVHDTRNLHTFIEEEQGIVVNKVKSLCFERGITSYENAIEALKSHTVPNLIKSELEVALKASESVLEGVGSFVIGTIKGESVAFPWVKKDFESLTNGEIIEQTESKISSLLFDLKKEDLHITDVASNLQHILDDQNTILPINIKTHLENLISDYVKDLAATQIQKAFRGHNVRKDLASEFNEDEGFAGQEMKMDLTENQEMDVDLVGKNLQNTPDIHDCDL